MLFPYVELYDINNPIDIVGYSPEDKPCQYGGLYIDELQTIILYRDNWGTHPIWYATTLLHEFIHHLGNIFKFSIIHKLIHNKILRRLL